MRIADEILMQRQRKCVFESLQVQNVSHHPLCFREADHKTVETLGKPGNVFSFVQHRIVELKICASI
jgi:hypothetical protein